jgi:hypothetical protein
MKLFQIVTFDDLKRFQRYHVLLPDRSYMGYFCDYDVKYVSNIQFDNDVAIFIDKIPDPNLREIRLRFEYFDRRIIFKRCVDEEEQAIVRRAFYEKKVVNQIISQLLGHAVIVY